MAFPIVYKASNFHTASLEWRGAAVAVEGSEVFLLFLFFSRDFCILKRVNLRPSKGIRG
jgi:hypothetical protein